MPYQLVGGGQFAGFASYQPDPIGPFVLSATANTVINYSLNLATLDASLPRRNPLMVNGSWTLQSGSVYVDWATVSVVINDQRGGAWTLRLVVGPDSLTRTVYLYPAVLFALFG